MGSNNKENRFVTLKQLVASYFVAKAITEIREEAEKDVKDGAKEGLPSLNVLDKTLVELYERYAELVNYVPALIILCKQALEDIEKYNFAEDPSVMVTATKDVSHLSDEFGSSYALLRNISLKEHTIGVFKRAIEVGETKGRVMQIAVPMLAALLHDFGKSTLIREELLGEEAGSGYRAHADVSKMYIDTILTKSYHKVFGDDINLDMISNLSYLVRNHHSTNRAHMSDASISFIRKRDKEVRKIEMNKVTKENLKKG